MLYNLRLIKSVGHNIGNGLEGLVKKDAAAVTALAAVGQWVSVCLLTAITCRTLKGCNSKSEMVCPQEALHFTRGMSVNREECFNEN